MLVRLLPQAETKEVTTDENKHPPTSAPMSSSAQNINNNKWKESVAFGTKIYLKGQCAKHKIHDASMEYRA